jgi:hypothetical protein
MPKPKAEDLSAMKSKVMVCWSNAYGATEHKDRLVYKGPEETLKRPFLLMQTMYWGTSDWEKESVGIPKKKDVLKCCD